MEEEKKSQVVKVEDKPSSAIYQSGSQKIVTALVDSVGLQLSRYQQKLTDYQKTCIVAAINVMTDMAEKKHRNFNTFNKTIINSILFKVAMFQLNICAEPRECYLQFRNMQNANASWTEEFEFGLEGDGNDKILRKYGVGIKRVNGIGVGVHQPWLIREGDEFTLPQYKGLGKSEPTWIPKNYTNKVIAVLYPIEMEDGTAEYLTAFREDVVRNLQAHITNNILSKKYDSVRAGIIKKIASMNLNQILEDDSLSDYISPAWRNPQSREAMIVRKMRNNATKGYPKDFGDSFIASEYEKTFEDYDQYRKPNGESIENDVEQEINESGKEPLKIEKKVVDTAPIIRQTKAEPKKVEAPQQEKEPSKEDIAKQIDDLGLGW